MTERTATTQLEKNINLASAVVSGVDRERGMNRPVALLLEDEPLIAMDVEITLIAAGFDVHCLLSCEEAHGWLELNRPDVVIVDIVLRDGRCTEVVSRLLQSGIPFIVHSGDRRGVHIGTPFDLGAWLTKPAAPNALVQAVTAAAKQFEMGSAAMGFD